MIEKRTLVVVLLLIIVAVSAVGAYFIWYLSFTQTKIYYLSVSLEDNRMGIFLPESFDLDRIEGIRLYSDGKKVLYLTDVEGRIEKIGDKYFIDLEVKRFLGETKYLINPYVIVVMR